MNETVSIASLYGIVSLIVLGLLIEMARVYVHNKSEKRRFNVEKENKKKKPEALTFIESSNPYAVFTKISEVLKKGDPLVNGKNDTIDDSTILGKI